MFWQVQNHEQWQENEHKKLEWPIVECLLSIYDFNLQLLKIKGIHESIAKWLRVTRSRSSLAAEATHEKATKINIDSQKTLGKKTKKTKKQNKRRFINNQTINNQKPKQ